MRLFSATDAISQSIKAGATHIFPILTNWQIVMACHTFPKDNGCVGNVQYHRRTLWYVRNPSFIPSSHQSCLFCPNEGGAFKQTQTGHWAHLLCAIYIPELGVGNAIYMEPVEGVELVPKSRWKLVGKEPSCSGSSLWLDLLVVQGEVRRLHPMRQPKLLHRVPCHLCSPNGTPPRDEIAGS